MYLWSKVRLLGKKTLFTFEFSIFSSKTNICLLMYIKKSHFGQMKRHPKLFHTFLSCDIVFINYSAALPLLNFYVSRTRKIDFYQQKKKLRYKFHAEFLSVIGLLLNPAKYKKNVEKKHRSYCILYYLQ